MAAVFQGIFTTKDTKRTKFEILFPRHLRANLAFVVKSDVYKADYPNGGFRC
jgi:4'-phosphopantetheinyl transferase EntD